MQEAPKGDGNPPPFGNIALSLSGGGYRAAAFHLGALDVLHRLDLLKDVSTLSTVSGGTFTGMQYALSLKADIAFRDFYDQFKATLENVDLPSLAFDQLNDGTPSIPSRRWDLITAIAQVYDDKLFQGQRFGVFWSGKPIPLTELIFNATEFRTAVAFRFRKSQHPNAKIGNGKVFITAEQARQIRIADIVAASSCFPGGFEPLSFPDDFNWPDDDVGRKALEELRQNEWCPLPLMDGGVYDNQGMGSLMLNRRHSGSGTHADTESISVEDFGLFIFSDTDQKQASLYSLPGRRPSGLLRLKHLSVLWWLLLAASIATALVSIKFTIVPWNLFPLGMAIGTVAALIWVRRTISESFKRIPKVGLNAWDHLKRLKTNQFIDMLELRASSLVALASSVFMRRIRRLVFDSVYNDISLTPKLVSNLIYGVLEHHQRPPELEWLEPSDRMRKVAEAANTMPTTLWFTDPQQMKDLIACGQISICHKLILHIASSVSVAGGSIPPSLQAVHDKAHTLFLALNDEPYSLL
jgi:predicted acylesterase/phospholipase RssA